MDVQLQEDGGIPVVPFLEACKSVLTIFGKIFIIILVCSDVTKFSLPPIFSPILFSIVSMIMMTG